jgi:hypothetical protein
MQQLQLEIILVHVVMYDVGPTYVLDSVRSRQLILIDLDQMKPSSDLM